MSAPLVPIAVEIPTSELLKKRRLSKKMVAGAALALAAAASAYIARSDLLPVKEDETNLDPTPTTAG